ncbi:MAG TPA: VirB4 family type IV secretion/conjugal transfer ATPase [Candidatus Megaira endosymbiont of Hartmannula sinica]|nr:VirB4 family type IV secretion/conjugal transfer ATPase [Candidatus Megaera endosymbiont of Hartmannula sinica]
MLKLLRNMQSKEFRSQQEKNISDFIPYSSHFNKNTILTKTNGMIQVIKVTGFSFETADDEDLDIKKNMLNSLFKNMSVGNVTLYFHTVRKKHNKESRNISKDVLRNIKNNDFVSYLEESWDNRTKTHDSYSNDLYISILYEDDKEGAAIVKYLIDKIKSTSTKESFEEEIKENYESLNELSNRVLNSLRDYNPKLLGVREEKESETGKVGGIYCEICEFLAMILNCGDDGKILFPGLTTIDKYIPKNRLFFGNKSIESNGSSGRKFAGVVSLKEYGPKTNSGIFDVFLHMPFEFIMTQSFKFSNRTVAINKMQLQQNRMIQAEDKATSQIAEISMALDMAMSGDISFGEHHLSILCIADNLKALENNLSVSAVELSNCGMIAVREDINMEPCYFAQLPGNADYIVRKSVVNSLNLAGFASFHNYPIGSRYNNFWGDYVVDLDTTSGSPFYFNFHVRDVGHSLIIGPTGSGKTVLMNFFVAKAQKFYPRTFFFDKDRGAEIFIRSIGGVYNVIDPGARCGFNPLQMPDNSENRTFLLEWLEILVTSHGEKITAEDVKVLNEAIEGNYRLDKKDRKLSNIVPFLGAMQEGSLASRISFWHGNGAYASIFDNDIDKIDFASSRAFGFEMGMLLANKTALPPVLLYIFHRINTSLDGSKTIIVLDEAWALIDNPVFAPKIKDWLKVLRKLNTFVIFATQSVEDASSSQISSTLIQQTATQIFLPNLKASEVYKTKFMLSDREYNLVKNTNPSSRYFLIKQGSDAVVARINLIGMNDIINILSSRVDTVLLLEKIIKKYGEKPEEWMRHFYDKVSEIE